MDEAWLNTVRMARDCGDISSLFPPGVTSLLDCPYTLHENIKLALFFLSWEELPKDERPPKHIWLDTDRLKGWWKAVDERREAKMKGEKSVHDMPENELLKQMMGRTSGGS